MDEIGNDIFPENFTDITEANTLGRVDGFEQDEGRGESDDGSEVSCSFLAA